MRNAPRALLLGLLCAAALHSATADELWHAGPLFDHFELNLAPGHRTEAAGPLYYNEQSDTQHTWAFPPLLSLTQDPAVGMEEFDFFYPVLTYDRYGEQHRFQFCQIFAFAGGESTNEKVRERVTIFPLYFQQRSSDPNQDYTAVVPFYGHLKNHLFRDDIFFVMFPFFAETRKKEVITDNYVYPIFHLRHGPGLAGWQVWPLAGHERKAVTTMTNGFNEIQAVPGHDKLFLLWPIYFNDHTSIGTTNPVWVQAALPLYSFERSPQRDATTVIWPFFSHIDDRDKKYREWDAPWPFIEFARGEGKTTTRVWPLFSQSHSPTLEDDFYLWPIYKYERARLEPLDHRRTRIAFFLYSDARDENTETGAVRRRRYLWPLFVQRKEFNESTRLQVLALLEPFVQGSHKMDRDYSPLWSVWRAEQNPRAGRSSQSLLWNLYRRDVAPERKRVSMLFGLFQYQVAPAGKTVRLFYLPIARQRTRASE